MTDSLLPRNATHLEQALETAAGPRDAGVESVRTVAHPDQIPTPLLPWLAWGERIPHWPDGAAARRAVTARSHRLHGQIGTAAGLRAGARLMGGAVTRIEGHPAKTFLGHWDADSRHAWLAAHPELRLYARRERAAASGLQLGHGHCDESLVRTDAVFRATTRATVVHRGEETELTVREWRIAEHAGDATLELARHDQAPGLHCGQALAGPMARYSAAHRLYRIDQRAYRYGVPALELRQLPPGFAPLSADVEPVAERALRLGAGCLSARAEWQQEGGHRRRVARAVDAMSLGACFPARMDALTRLYRRVRLHDPGVAPERRSGPSYLGRTRLGLPAWETLARVRLPARTGASRFCGDAQGAAGARGAHARIAQALGTMAFFQAAAQRIRIDTRNFESLRARATSVAGDVVAGQINPRT